jgi:hypothetical protein
MDIEKMYNDTKKKINQTSILEENTYMQQLLKQDKLYYTQLYETIQIYPSSKLSDTNTAYTTELSKLNGISKTIKTLHTTIQNKVIQNDRIFKQTDTEIKNLKKMYSNLEKNDGNIEELDLTSQRLLNDYVNIYSTKRIMIMIKGIIVFFLSYLLFSDAMKHPELRIYIVLWGICIILLFVISYFRYKWATSTSLPTSATKQPAPPITANDITPPFSDGSKNADGSCKMATEPLTEVSSCNQSQYGCCPDNMTISNSIGSNCNNKSTRPPLCSRTQYGCCPDGHTVSNADRSNCVGSCAYTEFGCCPNGVTISNTDRSNCNVPICTSTKYGCCPNGTTRNQIGSNC